MFFVPLLFLGFVWPLGQFTTHSGDREGWGIRISPPSPSGPFLVGESIENTTLLFTLLNYSNREREHDSIVTMLTTAALDVSLVKADGTVLASTRGQAFQRDPAIPTQTLWRRSHRIWKLTFSPFGYDTIYTPGRYRVDATLNINGLTVVAPPVYFRVVDLDEQSILTSQSIPIVGPYALLGVQDRPQLFIQQIQLGNKIVLIFRRCSGPKHDNAVILTTRIAELAEKAEVIVRPNIAPGKPIVVIYQDKSAPKGTRILQVSAADGSPWIPPAEELPPPRLLSRP